MMSYSLSNETRKYLSNILDDLEFFNKLGWSESMKDEFIKNIIYKWREWLKCLT